MLPTVQTLTGVIAVFLSAGMQTALPPIAYASSWNMICSDDDDRARIRSSVPYDQSIEAALQVARACGEISVEIEIDDGGDVDRDTTSLDADLVDAALLRLREGYSWLAIYDRAGQTSITGDAEEELLLRRLILVAPKLAHKEVEPEVRVEVAIVDADLARATEIRDVVKLSYQKNMQATARLRRIARDGSDPAVRRAAFSALSSTTGSNSLAFLSEKGLRDPDGSVRTAIARMLMRAGSAAAAKQVTAAAERERDPAIKLELTAIASEFE